MPTNPFISDKKSPNAITSASNKYAIVQFVTEIAVVINQKEAVLTPTRTYPGSDYDQNFRKFISLLIQAKKTDPNIVTHPYISPAYRILRISGDRDEKIRKYAESINIEEGFDGNQLLKVTCKFDQNGNVIGLRDDFLRKDVYGNYTCDNTTKANISEGFSHFFNSIEQVLNKNSSFDK